MGIFLDILTGTDNYLTGTIGGAGAVGTGGYTIALLVRPKSGNNNCGMTQPRTASAAARSLLEDSLNLYGENDFSSGDAVTLAQDAWYVAAQSKPSGANPYRHHLWAYASDGSGTMTHAVSTGSANHGDGSAATEWRVGWAGNRGNGDIAVVALWTSALSDGQLDTLKSGSLAAWVALSPDELVTFETWNGSTGWTTAVGTSSLSSITGTVGVGSDPPDFDFSLTAAADPGVVNLRGPAPGWVSPTGERYGWTGTGDTAASTTVTPSTIAATAAVAAPTVAAGAVAAPGTVTATAVVGSPTIQAGAVTVPSVVAATSLVGSPTVQAGSVAVPTTVAGAAAVGSPTIQAGGTVIASTVPATASVPTPTLHAGVVVTAATVAADVSVPTPSVSAGGNATVAPSTVPASVTLPAPTVQAGSVVNVTTVAGVAAIATPAVAAGAVASLPTVAATASIPVPVVTTGEIEPGNLTPSLSGSTLIPSLSGSLTARLTASVLTPTVWP